MKTRNFKTLLLAAIVCGGSLIGPGAVHSEESAPVTAYLAWTGSGRTYDIGPEQAVFVGALVGPIYVETEQGLVPSGSATCPVMVDIDMATAMQAAKGRCLIENTDGDRIYADVDCSGVFRVGCSGTMTLTGGTGAFEGISGSGEVTVRSERRAFVERRSGVTEEEGAGIMIVEELTYTVP